MNCPCHSTQHDPLYEKGRHPCLIAEAGQVFHSVSTLLSLKNIYIPLEEVQPPM